LVTQTDTSKGGEVDRRRFLKRAGTVAWLTPAILTLSTKAAYATHCTGRNAECGAVSGSGCNTTGFLVCCTQCSCQQTGPTNNRRCRCLGTCPSTPS
jgi:hypothetical protein